MPPAPQHARFGGIVGDVTGPFVDVLTSVRDRLPVDEAEKAFADVARFLGRAVSSFVSDLGSPKQLILRAVSVMGWPAFVATFIPGIGPVFGQWLVQTLPISAAVAERCAGAADVRAGSECALAQIAAEIAWRVKLLDLYTSIEKAANFAGALVQASRNPTLNLRIDRAAFERTLSDLQRQGLTEQEAVQRATRMLRLMPQDLSDACAAAVGGPCRQDAIAALVNARLGRQVFDLSKFDLATGSSFGLLEEGPAIPGNLSSREYADRLSKGRLSGAPQPMLDELSRLFDVARAREAEASVPLAERWRAAEEAARAAPADAALRRSAEDLRIAYEAATTPSERLRDTSAALAAARSERAAKGRLQPPVPAAVITALDGRVRSLDAETAARFRDTPVAPGTVRVLLDPTPGNRVRQAGTIALLSAPLWGYALYRHRATVLTAIRGILHR